MDAQTIDPRTVHADRRDLQVLDVREDDEWAAGRIDGAVTSRWASCRPVWPSSTPTRPVVTVCRSGGRAGKAAEYLTEAGLTRRGHGRRDDRWAEAGLPFTARRGLPGPRRLTAPPSPHQIPYGVGKETMIEIHTIETTSLGDRSYLAHDGATALVVDPQRDIDRVLDLAARLGVRVTHVVETHVHNDYVTGGLELARRTGARYLVPAGSGVDYDHVAAGDGDVVRGRGHAPRCPAHPRAHPSPRLLRAGDRDR